MKPLDLISVSHLSKLIKKKEVSPVELLNNTLKKIEKFPIIIHLTLYIFFYLLRFNCFSSKLEMQCLSRLTCII
jgi:Asp-tRNA(Asn)/Glu-tRNA(Gln) amidotransferase A subunit family amidase